MKYNIIIKDECNEEMQIDTIDVPVIDGIDSNAMARFILSQKYNEYKERYPECNNIYIERSFDSYSFHQLQYMADNDCIGYAPDTEDLNEFDDEAFREDCIW